MTMDLIRMWTPGWSSNGTHGMMHTQGNPKYYYYVTCRNAMSRRIVMTAHGVMCDIRSSAIRGGPLIGAERWGFPPHELGPRGLGRRGGLEVSGL